MWIYISVFLNGVVFGLSLSMLVFALKMRSCEKAGDQAEKYVEEVVKNSVALPEPDLPTEPGSSRLDRYLSGGNGDGREGEAEDYL